MGETEGYQCLVLMTPAALYQALVERAEAHGNSLAMEALLMLERDVENERPLLIGGRAGEGDEVRG